MESEGWQWRLKNPRTPHHNGCEHSPNHNQISRSWFWIYQLVHVITFFFKFYGKKQRRVNVATMQSYWDVLLRVTKCGFIDMTRKLSQSFQRKHLTNSNEYIWKLYHTSEAFNQHLDYLKYFLNTPRISNTFKIRDNILHQQHFIHIFLQLKLHLYVRKPRNRPI